MHRIPVVEQTIALPNRYLLHLLRYTIAILANRGKAKEPDYETLKEVLFIAAPSSYQELQK